MAAAAAALDGGYAAQLESPAPRAPPDAGQAPEERELEQAIEQAARAVLASSVGDQPAAGARVGAWASDVAEALLKRLQGFGRPLKYVVNCTLQQHAGSGLHAAAAARWSRDGSDGQATVVWEGEAVRALVTVYYFSC